jgi:hypothetical protein
VNPAVPALRRLALLACLALPPGTTAALAQPAQPAAAPEEAAPARPPARPRLARQAVSSRPLVPQIDSLALLPSAHASVRPTPRDDLAPVPNRDIEAPSTYTPPEPRIMPEMFRSSMPGRGATAQGVSAQNEERVYSPAPGARLTVPFISR